MQPQCDALIGFHDVAALTGLGRSYLYEMIREGTFPAPIKIGSASRWSLGEVAAWIESKRPDPNRPRSLSMADLTDWMKQKRCERNSAAQAA